MPKLPSDCRKTRHLCVIIIFAQNLPSYFLWRLAIEVYRSDSVVSVGFVQHTEAFGLMKAEDVEVVVVRSFRHLRNIRSGH